MNDDNTITISCKLRFIYEGEEEGALPKTSGHTEKPRQKDTPHLEEAVVALKNIGMKAAQARKVVSDASEAGWYDGDKAKFIMKILRELKSYK